MLSLLLLSSVLGASPQLDDDSFQKWRDSIRPSEAQTAFLEIGWHESFFSAVNEARETNRPILLWTMNGHPLGCT